MITEHQQELAARCALGELTPAEEQEFFAELQRNSELRDLLRSAQVALEGVARSVPQVTPPSALKQKILGRLRSQSVAAVSQAAAGLSFIASSDTGWKPLPIAGAYIKLLSLQSDRGYAVLLGKLDPGVRYPAHTNAGPEDFYILTGDLHVGAQELGPGDFHHADGSSRHGENYSVQGCTLLAVLTTDDPLVQLALA